ncbi:MAG: protein kinase [Phycisphaerales bacterium]|nr:protein kinase [Phycisphaerales bacterium]
MVNPNSPTNDGPPGDDDPPEPGPFGPDDSADYLIHQGVRYPRRIGSFTLRSFIGRGSFGLVFHAERSNPLKHVALKILRPDVTEEISIRRFMREADHLAALDHDNIVRVFESGVVKVEGRSTPYFVMGLIEGASPINVYVIDKQLGEAARVRLVIKVARAVQHMHDRGMVHRDLKPSNVLVDSGGKPQIIDVSLVLTGDPITRFEQLGTWCGSLPYMAPEQFDGPNNVTPRTDVYALGVILHELLTEKLPYDIRDVADWKEIKPIIQHTPPTRPSDHVKLTHPELDAVVARALEKDLAPSDGIRRLKTASDFADELEAIVGASVVTGSDRRRSSTNIAMPPETVRGPTVLGRVRQLRAMAPLLAAVLIGGLFGDRLATWTGLAGWYERWLLSSPLGGSLVGVAIIDFADEDEPARVAEKLGIAGFDPDNVHHHRALHASLLRALKGCQARSIALDIEYKPVATPFDRELRSAIAELDSGPQPIRVFGASESWNYVGRIPPDTMILAPPALVGVTLLIEDRTSAWVLDVALQRGQTKVWPGLVAAVCATSVDPRCDYDFHIDAERETIQFEFFGKGDLPTRVVPDDHPRPLTSVQAISEPTADDADCGILAGDRLALIKLALPPQSVINNARFSYERVLAASPSERLGWFDRKIVLIGNTVKRGRVERDWDLFETPHGERMWGVYAHAAGISGLLTGRIIRYPAGWMSWLAVVAVATTAFGIVAWRSWKPRCLRRPAWRAFVASGAVLLAMSATIVASCVYVSRHHLRFWHPFDLMLALMLGALLASVSRQSATQEPHTKA